MNEQFVNHEIAEALKDLGFNELCLEFDFDYPVRRSGHTFGMWKKNSEIIKIYKEGIAVPLYQQVTDWFREQHNIMMHVTSFTVGNKERTIYGYEISGINKDGVYRASSSSKDYVYILTEKFLDDYYKAYDKMIEVAIGIIKAEKIFNAKP